MLRILAEECSKVKENSQFSVFPYEILIPTVVGTEYRLKLE